MAKQTKRAAKSGAKKPAAKVAAKKKAAKAGGKKKAVKAAPKEKAASAGVTRAEVIRQLKTAAKALNHPTLRPKKQKGASARMMLMAADTGAQQVITYITYCKTEKRPIGQATTVYNDAEQVTENHIQQTGDDAETVASN